MARRQSHRGRPKKRLNRYDPNNPSYLAVHGPRFVLAMPALGPTNRNVGPTIPVSTNRAKSAA